MEALVILLAVATFFSTLIGGLFIFRFRKYLPYFFAFAAGSLMAVAFLDIFPESLEISESIGLSLRYVMLTVVVSFFFYSLIERFFLTHKLENVDSHGHIMGPIGAGSLVIHSLLDGVAIGSAFHVNASVGLVVAFAVIFHDFTDGINTVTVMLRNKQHLRRTLIFLLFDAIAPVIGVLATTLIAIPQDVLALILAMFVGEFVYIGASTLLPETREHKSKKIIIAMALGITIIAVLTSII